MSMYKFNFNIKQKKVDVNTNKAINVKSVKEHNKLENLDYEHSGHTGFASQKELEAISNKVITDDERTKLSGIDAGAQVNKIESIKVNGTEVKPNSNKEVNITVDASGIAEKAVSTHNSSSTAHSDIRTLVSNAQTTADNAQTKANEIEDLIVKNGVIDGSPRDVYENLSALQTAYPSGASGVYLTRDNGHWHYWNGSAWTDGGVYQAPELSTQDREKIDMVPQLKDDLSEVKTEIGLNKIVFSDFNSNKYIATNGATIDLSNIMVGSVNRKYAVVYCSEGDMFTISGQGGESARLWAFADSSNVVLEVAESSIAEVGKVITAPKNTAYLVVNTSEDVDSYYDVNKFKMLEEVANDLQFLVFYNGINIDTANKMVVIEAQPYLKGKTKKFLTKNIKVDYSNYPNGFYVWYNDITDEFYANTDTHTEPYFYLVGAFSVKNLFKSFSFSKFTVDKMENDTLPYNTLGSMEDCITDWWIYPTSIRYEGMRNKCYIGYVDSKGYQGVMSYDINTKKIRRKVLRKGDYADDHNAPSVTILDDGTIMVVCANHGTEKYHYVYYSTKKESIEEFTTTIYENHNGFVTYSQVFKCGGKFWMFYRVNDDSVTPKTWYWNYRTSTDGKSWSEEKVWLQSGTTQYYVIARPYNDTKIKLYMLSNASLGETDIRLGFIDCNTNKLLNSDMTTQITSLDVLTSPIAFSAFNIICPKNAYNRLYSIANGTDLSFVIARGSQDWNITSYHYYKYNGSTWVVYDLPNAGKTFYDGYNYQGNHVEIVDVDTVIMCINKNNKWYLEMYNIVDGSFQLNKVIAETNSENVKFIRPFKVKDWYAITYMKGYYTEYYEGYYTDMYISELT